MAGWMQALVAVLVLYGVAATVGGVAHLLERRGRRGR